jgi:ankyrin repeat protein
VARLLLKHQAKTTVKNVKGETPLLVATFHHEVARLLVEHGASTRVTDNRGETPLYRAKSYCHGKTLAFLYQFREAKRFNSRAALELEIDRLQQFAQTAIASSDDKVRIKAYAADDKLKCLMPLLQWDRFSSVEQLQRQIATLEASSDVIPEIVSSSVVESVTPDQDTIKMLDKLKKQLARELAAQPEPGAPPTKKAKYNDD